MPNALKFNGVNNYAIAVNPPPKPTGNAYLEIDIIMDSVNTNVGSSFVYIGTSSAGTRVEIGIDFNNRFLFRGRGSSVSNTAHTAVSGERYLLRLAYENGKWVGYVDGVEIGSYYNGMSDVQNGQIHIGCNAYLNVGDDAYSIVSIAWVDEDTPSNNLFYSADASDRSNTGEQPVFTETVNNNHATGYNFPTDGSAWESTGGSLIPVSNSLGLLSSSLAPVYNNLSSTSSVLGGVSSNFDISSSVLSAVNGATTVSSSSLSNISSSRVVSSSVLGTANTSTQLLSSTLGSTQHTVPLLSSTLGTVTSPVEVVSSVLTSVVSAIDNSVVISSSALSSITNSTDSRSSVLASASGSNKLDSSVLGSVTTSYELQSSVFNSITNSANIINNVLGSVSNSVGSKSSILGSVVKSIPITSSSLSGVQNVVVLTTSSGINTLDVESINSFTIYSEPVTAFTMVSINENRYTID